MSNSDKRSEETTKPLEDAGKAIGKSATRKASAGARKAAKAAVKKVAAMGAKVAAKAISGIIAILLPFLPYIIGFVLLLLLGFMAVTLLVESPSKNQEYQFESVEEMNDYGEVPEDDGYFPVTSISQGNALTKAFYTYFSDQSYWLITEDMDDKTKPISALDPEVEAKQIKDKYKREEMFYLNPDALYVLDEKLHGSEFRVPEQLIQPVPYEYDEEKDEIKLVDIFDEKTDGKMNVKSTKYDKDGKPTDDKVEGVWDYGFSPVFHYKKFKEEAKYIGTVTQVEVWDEKTQKKVWVAASGKEVKEKEATVNGSGEAWMIDQLVSPGGTIRNEIVHEWEDTGERWLPDTESYSTTEKIQVRKERTVPDVNEDGEQLYVHKIDGKNVYTTEEEGSVQIKQKFETYYEEEKITFYKKVEGTKWEKVPKYKGEPDMSDVTGTKYYKEYMESYTTYVPEDVLTSLDISKRLNTTDEKLLEAITPTEEVESGEIEEDVVSADVSNLKLGGDVNSQAYMSALGNLESLKRYGAMYGVDPYLMVALTAQEASGSHYDKDGNVKVGDNIGIMQIANTGGDGRSVTAYNFESGSNEKYFATYSELRDLETNIKWGVMYMAESLAKKGHDIATAIQSYNFGSGFTGPWSIETALEQQKKYAEGRKRADPNNPLGPYAYGDAYYVPHVLRHYASPDTQVPYAMKKDGTIVTLDNSEVPMGTVDAINASVLNAQTRGLWSTLWSYIEYGWDGLKEGVKGAFDLGDRNTVQFHGSGDYRARIKVNSSLNPDESWDATVGILAYQEQKPLSAYEGFTEEDFKDRFHLMFTNPFGQPIISSDSGMPSGVNPNDYFPQGDYRAPVDNPTVMRHYGYIKEGYEQNYHSGIDIVAFSDFGGQNIYAVATGIVKYVEEGDESQIIIDHSFGTETIYQYVGDIKVKEGSKVKKGDVIATGTNSSELKGTFHFGLRKNNAIQDPTWIVDPTKVAWGGGVVIDPNAKGVLQSPFAGQPYRFTSPYGMRFHPIKKVNALHAGVDLVAKAGSNAPIHSVADGEVVSTSYHKSAGYYITIDHGIVPEISTTQRLFSRYLHLTKGSIIVDAGHKVQVGSKIATMGSTGGSTGPHLHFELKLGSSASNSKTFDPAEVFDLPPLE